MSTPKPAAAAPTPRAPAPADAARRRSVLPDSPVEPRGPLAAAMPSPVAKLRSARPSMDGLRHQHLVTREELDALVREAVVAAVGEGVFQLSKATAWTGNIVEGVLKRLASLNKPLKYVVTTHLLQRCGAGLHSSAAAFWDPSTDGKMCVVWQSDTLQVVTTVFYVHI